MTFNMRGSRYSCVVAVEDENGQEKENQSQINEFLRLLEKITNRKVIEPDDIQKIHHVFENNRRLINYQHCKDNKLRSVLHITKYSGKLKYNLKQELVNTIVDVGYKLFRFSENNCIEDNCHALFFTAAMGDYNTLEKIVDFFRGTENESKLHDTREGDTVLSFMLKFGDYAKIHFIKCFEYLVELNVDIRRIDYYKNNIEEVIIKEKKFLEKVNNENGLENLNKIDDIIRRTSNERNNGVFCNKHLLFRSIIENDENFQSILAENVALIDSDDGENTLLQLAIIKNNLEITKVLLHKGANPNKAVQGRNEDVPLVLAAMLNRESIFQEILSNHNLQITRDMFIKFVTETKPKFLNYVLESDRLNVNHQYNGKTPLYYAIRRKCKKAVQLLLHRGASLDDNCINNINPKDLEEYINWCIKFDNFREDMEECGYKAFLVFDFFIKPITDLPQENNESLAQLMPTTKLSSEINIIQKLGSNKRLEHLLELPLIYIFILLKWQCVLSYYYCFVIMKFLFYTLTVGLVYAGYFNPYILTFILLVQSLIVYFNVSEFKLEYRRYTLHFILEILLILLLVVIYVLSIVNKTSFTSSIINQVSAFIIIMTSLSMLLTLGYHLYLSKWMAMAKRVFKNFGILLLFFIFPILAFAAAFELLLPFTKEDNPSSKENEDFSNLPRSIFRTLVMLSGDIGDKKFSLVGGYILFLLFSVGMAIILLNFWTGIAVSDIKEIEEQSTIVAFNNVIVFIESVERIYGFLVYTLFKRLPSCCKDLVCANLPSPFLESKVRLKRKKKGKFRYGIDLYINDEQQFKTNKYFKFLKVENEIISKIKALYDEKDLNIGKTLKILVEKISMIDDIYKHMRLYENYFKKIEQRLESKEFK